MVIFTTLGFITAQLRAGYGDSPTLTHPELTAISFIGKGL